MPGVSGRLDVPGERFERLLLAPRALVGLALLGYGPLLSGLSLTAILPIGLFFVAVSMLAAASLRRQRSGAGLVWTSVADAVGCAALLAVFSLTASSPAVLLVPLLGFELALKHGLRGAGIALAVLAGGLGGRAIYRAQRFGLEPRLWLILLMAGVTGLLLAIAGSLRRVEEHRAVAEQDRERLSELLRGVVEAVLGEAGARPPHARDLDVRQLVELACRRPELGPEIVRQIADAVAPRRADGPLSRRELEVLRLVAAGDSDREIAQRLFLSPGTIRVHMSNVVRKLGVADRSGAVGWLRAHDSGAPAGTDQIG